jgi:hypothetical protein
MLKGSSALGVVLISARGWKAFLFQLLGIDVSSITLNGLFSFE